MGKIRTLSVIALLSLAVHSPAQEFLPNLFLNDALAHKAVVLSPPEEKEGIEELKRRLKAEISYPTIDSLFENPNFRIERDIVSRFAINPEKEFASGRKDYGWYRKILKIDEKMRFAPLFMDRYRAELEEAEKRYGVDKRFIVGVLGIESNFKEVGRIGKYPAFNSLVTLYVLTGRKDFAFRELKELLIYATRTGRNVFDFNSSYAGAIGYAQFIPSSLNSLFIGKSGKVENSNPMDIIDCIYSIAYYLKRSGWDKAQNDKSINKNSRNWSAIRSYNPSEPYVMAVVEIATSLK